MTEEPFFKKWARAQVAGHIVHYFYVYGEYVYSVRLGELCVLDPINSCPALNWPGYNTGAE
jgi:hypothetical protein